MKQFKIVLLISLIAFSTPSQAQTAKEIAWMEKAKGVIKQMLKDPSTVQFQNVFVSRKAGMPIVCGRVNAKNSFGAYSGYQRFVSGAEQRLTFLENEVEGFFQVWQQLC